MPDPSRPTIKHLFAVSGNRCAFPGCPRHLIDPRTGTVLAKVCHITAKERGGPRYDLSLSEEQRNGFANLLLLCGEHHDVVDADEQTYTVTDLREMKAAHERSAQKAITLDDEIVELFASLINSLHNGRAAYTWVRGKWTAWLGTEADRRRVATAARAVSIVCTLAFVST